VGSRRFERSLTGSKSPRALIDGGGEFSTITRNIGRCLPKDTAWHCIRLELSTLIVFVNLTKAYVGPVAQSV